MCVLIFFSRTYIICPERNDAAPLFCFALLCYALLSTLLYYTILYYTILYYTILYYTILYYTLPCSAIFRYPMLCSALLCSALFCSAFLSSDKSNHCRILCRTLKLNLRFFLPLFHTNSVSEYMERHSVSRLIGSPPG